MVEGGGVNTGYFHACVKKRSRRNNLTSLRVGDILLEKVFEVREEIPRYFREHFYDYEGLMPNIDGIYFHCLSSTKFESLSIRISSS